MSRKTLDRCRRLAVLGLVVAAVAGCADADADAEASPSAEPPTATEPVSATSSTTTTAPPEPARWVASWGSGVQPSTPEWSNLGFSLVDGLEADQTLRQVVHTSVGGDQARVTISNRFGTRPLAVGRATVAVAAEAQGPWPGIDEATLTPLQVGGSGAFVVEPGTEVTSDVLDLAVPADHDLAVSLHLTARTGPPNGHAWGGETSWVGPGDLTAASEGFTAPFTGVAFLTGVDVRAPGLDGAVVFLGDSLTDGVGTIAPDSGLGWASRIRARLVEAGREEVAVLQMGMAGNSLLPEDDPTSAPARLQRDVLDRAGVEVVVVHLGTNDLRDRSADEIVGGLGHLVERARSAGLRVLGTTIPPMGGPVAGGGCAEGDPTPPEREATRQAVNERLRGGEVPYDVLLDLDEVLRDGARPDRISCSYAGFAVNFHPSPVGHEAMAAAVDLDALLGD